jgi:hypothetical protein
MDKDGYHGYYRDERPPQRKWVGLTDEEIDQICGDVGYGYIDVARAIEAKLKEKNNG